MKTSFLLLLLARLLCARIPVEEERLLWSGGLKSEGATCALIHIQMVARVCQSCTVRWPSVCTHRPVHWVAPRLQIWPVGLAAGGPSRKGLLGGLQMLRAWSCWFQNLEEAICGVRTLDVLYLFI
jgi:hypothetical protein